MKFCNFVKSISIVGLLFSTYTFALTPKPTSSPVPAKKATPLKPVTPKPPAPSSPSIEGVYEGTVTVKTAPGEPKIQLPIVFSLQFTDDDVATNPDEPYLVKKRIAGAFLLDGEAGPFPLNLADFEVSRGHFNLQYNRVSSIGTASPTASLRFECDRLANGSCVNGKITSSVNGQFATFTMYKSGKNAVALTAKPKYTGQWKGNLSILDGKNSNPDGSIKPDALVCEFGKVCDPTSILQRMNSFNFTLGLPELKAKNEIGFAIAESDGQDPVNPPLYELGSTPSRIGSAYINDFSYNNFTFTEVIFDYFHRKARLTYVNPNGGLKTSLTGTYDKEGNFTGGEFDTPNYGKIGNFTAEKIQ